MRKRWYQTKEEKEHARGSLSFFFLDDYIAFNMLWGKIKALHPLYSSHLHSPPSSETLCRTSCCLHGVLSLSTPLPSAHAPAVGGVSRRCTERRQVEEELMEWPVVIEIEDMLHCLRHRHHLRLQRQPLLHHLRPNFLHPTQHLPMYPNHAWDLNMSYTMYQVEREESIYIMKTLLRCSLIRWTWGKLQIWSWWTFMPVSLFRTYFDLAKAFLRAI